MIRITSFLSACFVVLILFMPSCKSPQYDNFEVMTFNIRYDNPGDGLFAWDGRKEMIYWMIEKYDPDILGVQEALKGQLDELGTALSEYAWAGVGRDDGICKGEYVPVFYRRDRFIMADQGHFWLSENPSKAGSMGWDAACTRMVSWIKLQETSSGIECFVFNTHFDHIGEEARLKSAQLLSDSIQHIAGQNAVIITGDLNCGPDSDPLNILADQFTNSRDMTEHESGPRTSFVGFPADLGKNAIIDHIFISSHFEVRDYEIIDENANGFFPSDHLPVRVSLSYKIH